MFRFLKKKRVFIPVLIILALLITRLFLPRIVKNYVNKVLNEIPGYYGEVKDIDISLFRGAYVINEMYLNKVNAKTQVPFLNFPKTDISIEWKSLFDGSIVTEIIMSDPHIIYMQEDQATGGKTPDEDDWTKAITDIVPISINHLKIHRGKLSFVELEADPNIDITIGNIELTADNLRNVKSKPRTLPSTLKATATSFGNGQVTLNGKLNIIKEVPDMDISFELKNANVTALNDFTSHYAGIDFKSGTFELFSEVAIADGYLKGYVKPLITNSKLIGKEDGFLEVLWEGFVGFFKFLFKNQRTDTLATRIPLEGNLNDVDAGVWTTIGNIFSNAWIRAFKGATDETIEYKDAFKEAKEDK